MDFGDGRRCGICFRLEDETSSGSNGSSLDNQFFITQLHTVKNRDISDIWVDVFEESKSLRIGLPGQLNNLTVSQVNLLPCSVHLHLP